MKAKYFFITLLFIFVIQLGCGQKNIYRIIYSSNDNNSSYAGYFLNKNKLVVKLHNNKVKNFEYYKYENEKLKSISENEFENMSLNKYEMLDNYLISSLKNENKKMFEYLSTGIKFKENSYIITLEETPNIENLYTYENKNLKKIDMDKIRVSARYGDTHLFYDETSQKLFFSGYKWPFKTSTERETGLYVYNFKKRKAILLHNGDIFDVFIPIKIPNTDYLLYIITKSGTIEKICLRKIN